MWVGLHSPSFSKLKLQYLQSVTISTRLSVSSGAARRTEWVFARVCGGHLLKCLACYCLIEGKEVPGKDEDMACRSHTPAGLPR